MHTNETFKIGQNSKEQEIMESTSVKFVIGCILIPLASRFLATTALISSSKPLKYNVFNHSILEQ